MVCHSLVLDDIQKWNQWCLPLDQKLDPRFLELLVFLFMADVDFVVVAIGVKSENEKAILDFKIYIRKTDTHMHAGVPIIYCYATSNQRTRQPTTSILVILPC